MLLLVDEVVLEVNAVVVAVSVETVAVVADSADLAVAVEVSAVIAVVEVLAVVAVEIVADVVDAEAVVVLVLAWVPRVVPRLLSNPIVMKVSLLPVVRKTCWSLATWSPERVSTEKRESQLMAPMAARLNTASGTPSVPSWLLVSWVVLKTSTLPQVRRFCTWVLPLVLQFPTLLILSVPVAVFTLSNSLTVLVVT